MKKSVKIHTMAKRKRRVSKKQLAPQHKLPEGFWQQAAAVVLVVVALLLVVAMFGAGGPLMEAVLRAGKWLLLPDIQQA